MASAPQNSEPANSVHSVEAKGIQFSPSSALGGITLDHRTYANTIVQAPPFPPTPPGDPDAPQPWRSKSSSPRFGGRRGGLRKSWIN